MNKIVLLLLGLVVLGAAGRKYKYQKSNKYLHPMSDELIEKINSMKTTWKVFYMKIELAGHHNVSC